jgi:uncharacterized membrane protein
MCWVGLIIHEQERKVMFRFILLFAILAALIHFGITGWRSLSGKDRWSLTKTLGYSIIVSLLAVVVMTILVILF